MASIDRLQVIELMLLSEIFHFNQTDLNQVIYTSVFSVACLHGAHTHADTHANQCKVVVIFEKDRE